MLKGRTCTDKSKQRRFLKQYETVASPTVPLEAIFATLIIDVKEGRDVATCNVPGAFLHSELLEGKRLFLRLRDVFVDIMCQVNPEYKQYVRVEKWKTYYICMLYNLYMGVLKQQSFGINYTRKHWKIWVLF